MSYKSIFAGAAGALGAAALSTQMASAEPQLTDVQMMTPYGSTMNDIIPAEIKPFIGDLKIDTKSGIAFEAGNFVNTYTDLDVTGIECDVIEPFFEQMDYDELAQNEYYGWERTAEEQAVVDSIRSLFQNRVLDLTLDDFMPLLGSDIVFLPTDLTQNASMNVHLECAGYQAPPPSMTPVEPR